MSVEEARKHLADVIDNIADERANSFYHSSEGCGEYIAEDRDYDDDAAIDRLILEVQAAMPCYFPVTEMVISPDWECGVPDLCPSCTAREALKEPVTA